MPTVDSPPGAHSPGRADIPLDASQEIAASHRAGPMSVIAPAGSGKTRTIVCRIKRLVRDGVPPGSILPLAFNRKAAAEMKTRLVSLGLGDVHARTIHSLGYEIVRRETGYLFDDQPARILTDALRSVYPGRDLDEVIRSGSAARQLSAVKTNLLDPDRLPVRAGEEALPFGPVFRRCLEIQAERRLIDYDDMVYTALRVLLDDRTARRQWQDRWTHILVDEFQDLNASQMLLLRILAHPRDNLFVVGDDDQAIYGWRGASVRGLLDFRAQWSSASVCVLSTNYRSASRIVSHAGWLIARNSERVPKDVRVRIGAPAGEFLVRLAPGLRAQAREAARWLSEEMSGSGLPWSDFAVLYRYNALAFIVTIALEEYGIPHDPQNAGLLFSSRAGQDVIAWLRYLADRPVPGDLARILSRPVRILPPAVASGVRSRDDLPPLLRNCTPGGTTGRLLGNFLDATARLGPLVHALPAGEFLEALDRAAGFRSARRRAPVPGADPDDADDATCFDVILALACGFQSADDFLTHAEGLLTPATPSPEETGTRDAVVLSTVHRAKGNEYSRVVFFDMSRRRRPRREEIEEERRVAYVGLTRARDALLVTAESRRQSPFLREAALNPACRMLTRVDLANKLRVLRRRYAGACRRTCGAARRADASHLRMEIDTLEEEFLCRSMLNAHAP
ncbi:MAG TPA: ATP-dependent helicase [Bacteroidota bacterium]|nr:ATP-dependent helicase [Bacteroidota bacterium]